MQGHGADDMQQDQDQEYGSDDHGGDDPATAGPRLWLIFLLGMRLHGAPFGWCSWLVLRQIGSPQASRRTTTIVPARAMTSA